MAARNWRAWVWQYGGPIAVLLVGNRLVVGTSKDDGAMLLWLFVVAPALLFLTGLLLPPQRVWVVPLGAILAMWVGGLENRGLDGVPLLFPLALFLGLP